MTGNIDFAGINAAALSRLPDLLTAWLPGGRVEGAEYATRYRPEDKEPSFKINVESGVWSDFGSGDAGSDPVSLYAFLNGLSQGEAAKQLADQWGCRPSGNGNGSRLAPRKKTDWLPVSPVPADAPPPNFHHYKHGAPFMTWEYRDTAGQTIGHVCRFDKPDSGKEILPYSYCRGPNGEHLWRFKSFTAPRPLYGLDRLHNLPEASVLMVEGEKACAAAQALCGDSMVVVTWPGGCKAVGKADFSPLSGRRVCLWPDNDEPGFKAMPAVAEVLDKAGAEVAGFVVPDAEWGKGADAADFPEWDRNKLFAVIKERKVDRDTFQREAWGRFGIGNEPNDIPPEMEVMPMEPAGPEQVASIGLQGGFLSSLELDAFKVGRLIEREPEPLTWAFKDSLLSGSVGFLVGPPGAGKSTFLIQLGASVAAGRPVFGENLVPESSGKVLALFGEEDGRVLHHRTHRIIKHLAGQSGNHFFNVQAAGETFFTVPCAGHDIRLVFAPPGQGPQPSLLFHELLNIAKRIDGLALIILDPLSRLYGQNENDNSVSTLFASLLEQLATETGAAVICAHHVSKGAGKVNGEFKLDAALHQDALRGASGFTGAARWQMNLFPLPKKVAAKGVGDPDAESGQYLAAKVVKKNYGPPEEEFFLKREYGGVLVPTEAAVKMETDISELERQAEEWVLSKVEESMDPGKGRLTKRTILDFSSEWKDVQGCSKTKIEQAVGRLIYRNELLEEMGTNKRNRPTAFLSLPPNSKCPEYCPEGTLSKVSKVSKERQTLCNQPELHDSSECPEVKVSSDLDSEKSSMISRLSKLSKVSPPTEGGEKEHSNVLFPQPVDRKDTEKSDSKSDHREGEKEEESGAGMWTGPAEVEI